VITIGADAIERPDSMAPVDTTIILGGFGADGDGIIHTIEVYIVPVGTLGGFYVGIFEPLGSNDYKCRSAFNPTVAYGYNKFEDLSLAVAVGDILGWSCAGTGGQLERTEGGAVTMRYRAGNQCIPGMEGYYSPHWPSILSLKGIGAEPAGYSQAIIIG